MPAARTVRPRAVNNENDENSGNTRLTRAKTANLSVPEDCGGVSLTKKPLATKKSTNSITNKTAGVKRATLGDISNVTKNDMLDQKENKKPLSTKSGLASKTQTAGIQKVSRTVSSRSVLGAKDNNKKAAAPDLKRSASGSGVMGGAIKKRNTGSNASERSIREEQEDTENQPPQSGNIPARAIKEAKSSLLEASIAPEVSQPQSETLAVPDGVADLDTEDLEDPLMVAEYVVEIFDHLRELESERMPNPDYMDGQAHIEWHLRGVLVDWLIEVHTRFHLLPETLFLAVNIIDRFLSRRIVELEKLQLVGITAMFIASKYEEVLSPHVQNFKHVADDGFDEEEILKAERFVLSTLNYDLSYPNPMNFLRRISKADSYDIHTRTLGKYLLEISLLDHKFLCYTPSHLSAASMYLARLILDRGEWDATLAHYAGYTEEEIQPVFKLMLDYLYKPIVHEAFFKKYASKKFLKASILTRQWAKKNYELYFIQDSNGTTTTSGTDGNNGSLDSTGGSY